MIAINVQFSDSSQTEIVSYFGSPQAATAFSNMGVVESNDARWATFYSSVNGAGLGLPAPTASS